MNVYTIVCLCLFDQGVSGLLVTFVCETIKLSHRFRQVHDALLVINHPEKTAMIFEYFLIFDFLRCFEHLDFGQNTLTYDICF